MTLSTLILSERISALREDVDRCMEACDRTRDRSGPHSDEHKRAQQRLTRAQHKRMAAENMAVRSA